MANSSAFLNLFLLWACTYVISERFGLIEALMRSLKGGGIGLQLQSGFFSSSPPLTTSTRPGSDPEFSPKSSREALPRASTSEWDYHKDLKSYTVTQWDDETTKKYSFYAGDSGTSWIEDVINERDPLSPSFKSCLSIPLGHHPRQLEGKHEGFSSATQGNAKTFFENAISNLQVLSDRQLGRTFGGTSSETVSAVDGSSGRKAAVSGFDLDLNLDLETEELASDWEDMEQSFAKAAAGMLRGSLSAIDGKEHDFKAGATTSVADAHGGEQVSALSNQGGERDRDLSRVSSPLSASSDVRQFSSHHFSSSPSFPSRRLSAVVVPVTDEQREYAKVRLTTGECKDAFGSNPGPRNGGRKTCRLRNAFVRGMTVEANFLKGQTPEKFVSRKDMNKIHRAAPPGSEMKLKVKEHKSLDDFYRFLSSPSGNYTHMPGLWAAFEPMFYFNVGHGLFDGLYPMYVSMIQWGLQDAQFHTYLLCGACGGGAEARGRTEAIYGKFGGLGNLRSRSAPAQGLMDDIVFGLGNVAQKVDHNVNVSLGACRELDACRLYRDRMYKQYGLDPPLPVSTKLGQKRKAIFIENKRYPNTLLDQAMRAAKEDEDLANVMLERIAWSGSRFSQTGGDFYEQLKIVRDTDIHISGPGTGMMYQTFLADGAVHINLGSAGGECPRRYMEEYMAEGAPYLHAMYNLYPGKDIPLSVVLELTKMAYKLLDLSPPDKQPEHIDISADWDFPSRMAVITIDGKRMSSSQVFNKGQTVYATFGKYVARVRTVWWNAIAETLAAAPTISSEEVAYRPIKEENRPLPVPPSQSLSPVALVFKAYMWRRFLGTTEDHSLRIAASLKTIRGLPTDGQDTWHERWSCFTRNLTSNRKEWLKEDRDLCLMKALRMSFDQRFSSVGPSGWFLK